MPAPTATSSSHPAHPHTLSLVAIAGLGALSINMMLPVLPLLAEHFDTSYAVMQLAISGYLLAVAVLHLIIGPLSDRFGRRPVLLVTLAIFVLASLACVLTRDIGPFLVARFCQAVSSSGMVLSRAIVRDVYEAEDAATKIAYVTMGMAVAPMIGPALGGVLADQFGWEAIFYFCALAGLAVFLVVYFNLGETNTCITSDLLVQFRAYPDLLSSRRFWGYSLTASFASGAFFSFLGGGPYVGAVVLGLPPVVLGQYIMIIAFGYFIGNFLAGRWTKRAGMHRMLMAGTCVSALGILLSIGLFHAGLIHPLSFFGSIFLVGIGNGLCLPSANIGMVSARPRLAGSASGLGGAMMIGGGAALAALSSSLLSPQSGAMPLLLVMLSSAIGSIALAFYVTRLQPDESRTFAN